MKPIVKIIQKIADIVLDHVGITSTAISIPLTFLLFYYPFHRMTLVPYILTYSSCNLALIGFIFSILLGLRGGEIYKKLTATYPTKVKQIYKTVYRITVMSSLCAMFSLCIMATPLTAQLAKYIFAYILCSTFSYMVIGTLHIFNVLINLLINGIPN